MSQPLMCDTSGPYAYDTSVQILWVDTIDDIHHPTEMELSYGLDLIPDYDLTDVIGWETATQIIRDPAWGRFQSQRPGGDSIPDDSQMVFGAHRDGDDVRQVIATGDFGNVVFLPSGPLADHLTSPLDVFQVQVAQLIQLHRLRTGGGSSLLATFAVKAVAVNVTVGS